jgi:hypothetical protein
VGVFAAGMARRPTGTLLWLYTAMVAVNVVWIAGVVVAVEGFGVAYHSDPGVVVCSLAAVGLPVLLLAPAAVWRFRRLRVVQFLTTVVVLIVAAAGWRIWQRTAALERLQSLARSGGGNLRMDRVSRIVVPIYSYLPPGAFAEVGELGLRGNDLRDEDLADLGFLRRLYSLSVQSNSLTDSALDSLKGNRGLLSLYLIGNRFTGRAVAQVGNQNPLFGLHLDGSGFTDQALAEADQLGSLDWLVLSGSGIGDRAIVAMTKGGKVSNLDVRGTAVSAAGLKACAVNLRPKVDLKVNAGQIDAALLRELARVGLPGRLRIANLTGDEPWLAELGKNPSLAVLEVGCGSNIPKAVRERIAKSISKTNAFEVVLIETSFDDEDITPLQKMNSLKYLHLNPKTTSANGRNAIRKALPTVEVSPVD